MKEYKQSTILFQRNFLNPERVSEFLFCSICNEIFNNPLRLDCCHTFCYNCLKTLRKNSNKCPICNKKIIDSLISRDLLAFNIINDLEVFCNNENIGCPWKGKLSEIENHLKVCNKNINLLIESNEKKNQNKNDNIIENNNNNNNIENNININEKKENKINNNDNNNTNEDEPKIIKILTKINKTSEKSKINDEKLDKLTKSILTEKNKETLLTENSKNLIINFSNQIQNNNNNNNNDNNNDNDNNNNNNNNIINEDEIEYKMVFTNQK